MAGDSVKPCGHFGKLTIPCKVAYRVSTHRTVPVGGFFTKITRTVLFLAALLIIAPQWEQPRCSKTAKGEDHCDLIMRWCLHSNDGVSCCSTRPRGISDRR